MPADILFADSITKLPAGATDSVLVCGSHGGIYPAYLAVKLPLAAVIFNDAGVGKERAGISGIAYLQDFRLPAATVSFSTCRIGDSSDMARRGRISHVNPAASLLGVELGMACKEAADRLRAAPVPVRHNVSPSRESRSELALAGGRRIILIDSAALVEAGDAGQIIVTGSHGGLVGDDSASALRIDAFAAAFNDAGVGCDQAGIGRLNVLDRRGIAAFTVASDSARIGDARSSLDDGEISHANSVARRCGIIAGMKARHAVRLLVALPSSA